MALFSLLTELWRSADENAVVRKPSANTRKHFYREACIAVTVYSLRRRQCSCRSSVLLLHREKCCSNRQTTTGRASAAASPMPLHVGPGQAYLAGGSAWLRGCSVVLGSRSLRHRRKSIGLKNNFLLRSSSFAIDQIQCRLDCILCVMLERFTASAYATGCFRHTINWHSMLMQV